MEISTNDYTDFLAVVRQVGGFEACFYWDVSPTDTRITVFLAGGAVAAKFPAQTPAAKPGTFTADFPTATALNASLNVIP